MKRGTVNIIAAMGVAAFLATSCGGSVDADVCGRAERLDDEYRTMSVAEVGLELEKLWELAQGASPGIRSEVRAAFASYQTLVPIGVSPVTLLTIECRFPDLGPSPSSP